MDDLADIPLVHEQIEEIHELFCGEFIITQYDDNTLWIRNTETEEAMQVTPATMVKFFEEFM